MKNYMWCDWVKDKLELGKIIDNSRYQCRWILTCSFLALNAYWLVCSSPVSAADTEFGYADVVAKAQQLANNPFTPPPRLPDNLINLSYDHFRDIRFRPEKALWRAPGTNFDVLLVHAGLYYTYPVTLNIIDANGVQPLPYSPDLFTFGKNEFKENDLKEAGYAGFVLNYPLKREDLQSQVIVFAGASYFRAIGRDHGYGLSARGLAVDTALPSGEEFPEFREFWLEKPSPTADAMTVYALLDSKRVTGAYRFVIHPGETTVVEVKATVFERESVEELGIAPLTSMFQYGEESRRPEGYWRPEIHDSDGLLMENGNGEWIWRPLSNEQRLRVSSFFLEDPKGFGLLQRDVDFKHYEDLEARYELRPGAWIVPTGSWGKGRVKLTEIPTDTEINDNIVAYWIPEHKPEPGTPIQVEYAIHWLTGNPEAHETGHATATRIGKGRGDRTKRFVIDFEGGMLGGLSSDVPVKAVISVGEGGKLKEQNVYHNPVSGGWRLVFDVKSPKQQPLELRAFLSHEDSVLTETWSYLLEP